MYCHVNCDRLQMQKWLQVGFHSIMTGMETNRCRAWRRHLEKWLQKCNVGFTLCVLFIPVLLYEILEERS